MSFFEKTKRSRPEPIQQGENCDDEWGLYLRDPPIDRQKTPLTWWGEKANLFPNLAPKAQMLLPIAATVVPSERHRSDAGNTITNRRESKHPETLCELLFLRIVLKIHSYNYFQKILVLDSILGVFGRRFSIKGKMPDYSSDCFFSSDYNPHTDRSTF